MKHKRFKLLQDIAAPGLCECKAGEIKTIGEWTSLCKHLIGHNIATMPEWFEPVPEVTEEPLPVTNGTTPEFTRKDMIQFSQAAVHADRATRDVYGRMPTYLDYWIKKHKN